MGGFGSEQFERPWFREQMMKLGKKNLITSKHSGFVVNEWKGVGNKGHEDGFKDYRTYDARYS